MSLMPDVPGLDRYEREVEQADREAEMSAQERLERMDFEDEIEARYDRDEDYLRERAYCNSRGVEW